MKIGNKYNIKTISSDEFEGIIKEIDKTINGLIFVVIKDNWNITIHINLNHIVSFCELEEENFSILSHEEGEQEIKRLGLYRDNEKE